MTLSPVVGVKPQPYFCGQVPDHADYDHDLPWLRGIRSIASKNINDADPKQHGERARPFSGGLGRRDGLALFGERAQRGDFYPAIWARWRFVRHGFFALWAFDQHGNLLSLS